MNLLDRDLFELYRLLLTTVCAIYAIVVTARSILHIAGAIVGSDRKAKVARNYAVVMLLRLRIGRFKRELAAISFYCVLIILLVFRH